MPDIRDALAGAASVRVAVVGDLMLDRYTWGRVDRISPEAPVPVVEISHSTVSPGGAANAAICASALGAKVTVFGATGDDADHDELERLVVEAGCDLRAFRVDGSPTITKHRIWSGGQQLLRLDSESRLPPGAAATHLADVLDPGEFDSILVSDYDKGVVDRTSFAVLVSAAASRGLPLVVDPKVADFTRYAGSTLIKPNEREARAAFALRYGNDAGSIDDIGRYLVGEIADRAVVTRGSRGISYFDGSTADALPVRSRNVYDVTGAGDVVAAVLAVLAPGATALRDACTIANLAAGVCVGRVGTGGVSPAEIVAMQGELDG